MGALLARKLGALKCTLVLWDVDADGLKRTDREAREAGAPAVYTYVVDLSKRESVYEAAAQVRPVELEGHTLDSLKALLQISNRHDFTGSGCYWSKRITISIIN